MMDMTDGTLVVGTLADNGTFLTLPTSTEGWMGWPTANKMCCSLRITVSFVALFKASFSYLDS